MGVIDEESVDMKVREEDKKFIARVYSYSFIGLMLDWIKDDMKEAPEKIVHRFAPVSYTHLDVYKRQTMITWL